MRDLLRRRRAAVLPPTIGVTFGGASGYLAADAHHVLGAIALLIAILGMFATFYIEDRIEQRQLGRRS